MTRIQTPPGTSEVSHGGQPYHIDPSTGQFECPDEVSQHFLRMPGFTEIPSPLFSTAPPEASISTPTNPAVEDDSALTTEA